MAAGFPGILWYFNPRSPCGERRRCGGFPVEPAEFQSTLPVWGATAIQVRPPKGTAISIHAPRVGSDYSPLQLLFYLRISIHAPRVGSDIKSLIDLPGENEFQSTLPVWGATKKVGKYTVYKGFQSTLPVWGATWVPGRQGLLWRISIHAPRVGSDGSTPPLPPKDK